MGLFRDNETNNSMSRYNLVESKTLSTTSVYKQMECD